MVALWENPTIWLSQERQENLHMHICPQLCELIGSHLCMCGCVAHVLQCVPCCVCVCVSYVVHI